MLDWIKNSIFDNWQFLVTLSISLFSLFHAKKANEKSDEANQLSGKSIAVNYDATFNEFNIQLKNNLLEVNRIKRRFEIMKSQNMDFVYQLAREVILDITKLQTQPQFKRPSQYYAHYEKIECNGQDIKERCDVIIKIIITSQEQLDETKIFMRNYNEGLEFFDRIIKILEETINNDI